MPPRFIRSRTGANEWLPVQHPKPGQAVPYEVLPFEEMPHLVNPPAGWFVNCNNEFYLDSPHRAVFSPRL